MRFKKWNIGTPAERDVALLRSAGYPYLLSTVLAARGVTTAEAAAEALERDRSLSMSPMLMRDMDKAVARIQRAISQGETIAVFGDYDVDGITSTVLLMDYLKSCGVRCLRHIPRRIEEGYGLSKEAIQGLRDQGATLMITCLLYTSLSWDKVDFTNGTILVNTQLQQAKKRGGNYYLAETKSSKGRLITPAPSVMAALRAEKVVQAERRLMAGRAWNNKYNLVFTNEIGENLAINTVYKNFKKIAAEIGRPDARVHDLRHTFAVMSLQEGDDVKTVQSNLGHATASFTLDVYGHVSEKMKKESAARMEAFIESVKKA